MELIQGDVVRINNTARPLYAGKLGVVFGLLHIKTTTIYVVVFDDVDWPVQFTKDDLTYVFHGE